MCASESAGKGIDWTHHIDTDIFGLFLQYAYTGGYEGVEPNHQTYKEARDNSQRSDAYWIYESSPCLREPSQPTPESLCRQHAQIWVFAKHYDIRGLWQEAVKHLRALLKDIMKNVADDGFSLLRDKFFEVVDVIGYIYHYGRRFWGSKIKAEAPLREEMRMMVAGFARKYLSDFSQCVSAGNISDRGYWNCREWINLLEKYPLIAVDMASYDTSVAEW